MRRIIMIGTALAVLGAAAAAFAAAPFNTYSGSMSFSPNKAGRPAKPSPMGFTQVLKANGTNGNRAAPLVDLRSTIYGMVSDGKDFKTCTFAQVSKVSSDSVCNPKALVATANVHALLGPGDDPRSNAVDPKTGKPAVIVCNPGLRVWNSGQGKLTFFFWNTTIPGSQHYCGGIPTGATPPYTGTIKQVGPNMVLDVPLPSYVSTRVLKAPTWGSLISETITWKKMTVVKNGKTHAMFASVACNHGRRPWTQLFKATFELDSSSGSVISDTTQSFTKSGSQAC